MSKNIVIMNAKDNVATAIKNISKGEKLLEEKVLDVKTKQNIPFGHKVALRDIKKGEIVIKYGDPIGVAIKDILVGEHVHIHNMEGLRGRGDKKGGKIKECYGDF
ncbi:altronate dehydratase small subunit [Caldanaerovirga acetigignens]|uniref:Altronate dehydratase small subunit n=1 Tax=Caldanaerovirga acetigignens TaxID=447595 RepID=A0A1M7H9P1_9FIRM|nr:UxaA family hydrolase [Caldanaerovirga acetigignens]SHM25234.1 altronate dehydratase small subunit [Caldanaerovirga acetigignens]